MDLEMQSEIADAFLLAKPAFQLFGRVGGSIVQNEDDRVNLASKCFRNDDLLDKGLKIDKTLALMAGSVDLAIGDGESGKQVACATTMVARFVQSRFASLCRSGRLLALTRLNGGFFIDTDEPGTVL